MTPEQKSLIRSSFASLSPNADRVAARFYSLLFELDPACRQLFLGGLKFQRVKFMDMLGAALATIDDLDYLVSVVWQMGKRHAGYGVKQVHYDIVRKALLQAFRDEMGEDAPPECLDAWGELYDLMANAMKQAASEGSNPRP